MLRATFGIVLGGTPRIDLKALVARSRSVAGELNAGVAFLLKKNGVDVIWGQARLEAPGTLVVEAPSKTKKRLAVAAPKDALGPGRYGARHIVVATGARPRTLPGLEPDGR